MSRRRPLHPLVGALLVLLGGLALSALPLFSLPPVTLPPLPAPLDRWPTTVALGAAASLLAAAGVALGLRGARRRHDADRAAHAALQTEQEVLTQHLAVLGETAQREAEFAAASAAGLRAELAARSAELEDCRGRLAAIDAALLRVEIDAEGRLLDAAAGLPAGTALRLGAGAREALQIGQVWCGPLALPDGEVMLLRLQPLGGDRFLGLGLAQTALWRQRAELQQAVARQREQLDGGQSGGWNWALGAERVQLDRRALQLFDLPAAGSVEMETGRLTERFHADDLPSWRAALHRLISGRDGLLHLQLRVRRGEGWAWLLLRGAVTARDADGQAQRLAGTLIDLAAPLAAAQRGQWLERVDQAALQALGAAGFAWQADADDWSWNSAAPALLGSAGLPDRLRLEQALHAVEPGQREAVATLLRRVAGGGGEAAMALRLQDGLGQLRPARLRAWVEEGTVIGVVTTAEALPVRQAAATLLTAAEPVLNADQLQRAADRGIALQRGVDRFQGRVGLYLRSALAFADLAEGLPAKLRPDLRADLRADGAERGEAAQLALHSFKALAATLGCERLAQWGAAGEQRLRSGQAIDADWLLAFEQQLAQGLALLRGLAEPARSSTALRPDCLQHLEQGIARADTGLAAWLDGRRGELAPWLGDELDRLAAALAAQDFDAARALLAARTPRPVTSLS